MVLILFIIMLSSLVTAAFCDDKHIPNVMNCSDFEDGTTQSWSLFTLRSESLIAGTYSVEGGANTRPTTPTWIGSKVDFNISMKVIMNRTDSGTCAFRFNNGVQDQGAGLWMQGTADNCNPGGTICTYDSSGFTESVIPYIDVTEYLIAFHGSPGSAHTFDVYATLKNGTENMVIFTGLTARDGVEIDDVVKLQGFGYCNGRAFIDDFIVYNGSLADETAPILSAYNITSSNTFGENTTILQNNNTPMLSTDLFQITLTTDENSNCSGVIDWDLNYMTAIANNSNYKFATTDTTSHSFTVFDDIPVGEHCLYIHCVDSLGNDGSSGCLGIERSHFLSGIVRDKNDVRVSGANITILRDINNTVVNSTYSNSTGDWVFYLKDEFGNFTAVAKNQNNISQGGYAAPHIVVTE